MSETAKDGWEGLFDCGLKSGGNVGLECVRKGPKTDLLRLEFALQLWEGDEGGQRGCDGELSDERAEDTER